MVATVQISTDLLRSDPALDANPSASAGMMKTSEYIDLTGSSVSTYAAAYIRSGVMITKERFFLPQAQTR